MNEITGINLNPGQRITPGRTSQPRSTQEVRREQDSYNRVMGQSKELNGLATSRERAREAAEQLVAITFVLPILEEMRKSNHAAAPFAPSSGEKQFRSFLDAKLADEITKSAQFPLVDRITNDMMNRMAASSADNSADESQQPDQTTAKIEGVTQ